MLQGGIGGAKFDRGASKKNVVQQLILMRIPKELWRF